MSAWRMTPTSSCAGSDAAIALSRAVSPHASPVCPVVPSTCSRSAPLPAAAPPRRQGAPQAAPRRCCSRPAASPPRRQGAVAAPPLPQRRGRHGRRARASATRRGRGDGAGLAGLRAAGHRRSGVRGHGGGVSSGCLWGGNVKKGL